MIEGVVVKEVIRHPDERGYFAEIVRFDEFGFDDKQCSHAVRTRGANGWHIHRYHDELFYVVHGILRVVLHDCRVGYPVKVSYPYDDVEDLGVEFGLSSTPDEYQEVIISEYDPKVIKVPAGVAHGYKILGDPCDIIYWATKTYETSRHDEGRIEPDRWGIEWMRDTEVK